MNVRSGESLRSSVRRIRTAIRILRTFSIFFARAAHSSGQSFSRAKAAVRSICSSALRVGVPSPFCAP